MSGLAQFKPAQGSVGGCHHGTDRLTDFVRNRACHGAHLVQACNAYKLRARFFEHVFGVFLIGDVKNYAKRESSRPTCGLLLRRHRGVSISDFDLYAAAV